MKTTIKDQANIILIGHIASEPEKYFEGDSTQTVFPIAVKDLDGKTINFFRVVTLSKFELKKGTLLRIEGVLQNRGYDTKDGMRHYVTEILMDNYKIL